MCWTTVGEEWLLWSWQRSSQPNSSQTCLPAHIKVNCYHFGNYVVPTFNHRDRENTTPKSHDRAVLMWSSRWSRRKGSILRFLGRTRRLWEYVCRPWVGNRSTTYFRFSLSIARAPVTPVVDSYLAQGYSFPPPLFPSPLTHPLNSNLTDYPHFNQHIWDLLCARCYAKSWEHQSEKYMISFARNSQTFVLKGALSSSDPDLLPSFKAVFKMFPFLVPSQTPLSSLCSQNTFSNSPSHELDL